MLPLSKALEACGFQAVAEKNRPDGNARLAALDKAGVAHRHSHQARAPDNLTPEDVETFGQRAVEANHFE